MNRIIVTGGAGFIGANYIHHLFEDPDFQGSVLNFDKLTYAGNLDSLVEIEAAFPERYRFVKADICDSEAVARVFAEFQPDTVVNFAAESHVDRSIDGPMEFINTNVLGTAVMLDCALRYWRGLDEAGKKAFRFHHVSTDEVFGSLGDEGLFTESTPYDPSSPYSASKAGSDHLVRAWHRTFGLPVLLSNCSNNYGGYQFPEKLIPLMILNCLEHKPLPVYGKGLNVRDWLYVRDHCDAINTIIRSGKLGETYNVGGHNEMKTSKSLPLSAGCWTNSGLPTSFHLTRNSSLTSPTVPAMTSATPSTPTKLAGNWAGCQRKPLKPASARPYSGIWSTNTGGAPSRARNTSSSGWDWETERPKNPAQDFRPNRVI